MSRIAVLMPMMFFFAGIPLLAQSTAAPATLGQQAAEIPAASFAFDVATIKLSDADFRIHGGGFFASGYRVTNYPLSAIVFMAYFPFFKGNQVIGAPAWANNERYDIVAHIDEATAPSWLKLNPRQQQSAGRPILQKLLAERCKLIVHTVPSEVDGYALVVGKHGSHLQPAQPRETYPDGVKTLDPEGGKILNPNPSNNNTMSFFNAHIEDLASILGIYGSIIQDQTNLTGRYDFAIRRLNPLDASGNRMPDPQPADLWDLSGTGLEIKAAKIPSLNLVIDHIERPSPN